MENCNQASNQESIRRKKLCRLRQLLILEELVEKQFKCMQEYARALDGEITCLITYREANDPAYMPLLNGE